MKAANNLDWLNSIYQEEQDKSKSPYANSSLSLSPPKIIALHEALNVLQEHSKRSLRIVDRGYPSGAVGEPESAGECGYFTQEYRPLNRKQLHLQDRAKRIVRLLLEHGADLNCPDTGYTNRHLYVLLFEIAAKSNDSEYLEWFLKYSELALNSAFITMGGSWPSNNYNLHSKETMCPVHRLIEEGHLPHLRLLMSRGADPNRKKLVHENSGFSSFSYGTKTVELESTHTSLACAVFAGV